MFKKVLIANRGEVALRVMRACKELGVKTVAVYSTEDADTYPVRYADEAVCIGPAPAAKSYLMTGSIIAAAKNTGRKPFIPVMAFLPKMPNLRASVPKTTSSLSALPLKASSAWGIRASHARP